MVVVKRLSFRHRPFDEAFLSHVALEMSSMSVGIDSGRASLVDVLGFWLVR